MTDPATTFSLSQGGRFHSAMVRAGAAGGARGLLRFVGLLVVISWLPLVVLTARAGTALRGVDLPFFTDLGPWVRFFMVVPIMVLAERPADRMLSVVLEAFRRAGIVRQPDVPAFDAAVADATRRATADTIELILLALALVAPHLSSAALPALAQGTAWYGTTAAGDLTLTTAGHWYAWVSLPLVDFLVLRWVWRTVAWWGLLWRTSRLDLALVPGHPDRAAGLGTLRLAPQAFLPVFVGLSALAAVSISSQIRLGATDLSAARGSVVVFLLLATALLLLPQVFFLPQLARARRWALVQYGVTGTMITRRFESRWTREMAGTSGDLLETADASATADFGGTYGQVAAMSPLGISLREIITIVVPVALPFAFLLLHQYSLKEIAQRLLQLAR